MSASALFLTLAACVAVAASFVLVSRLQRLAGRWSWTEGALGLIIALAADSPEIASAITASARGHRSIGAGVVLGSNVFNLAALLGLSAIVARRIELHRRVVLLEGAVAVWVAAVALTVVSRVVPAWLGFALVAVVVVPYVVGTATSFAFAQRWSHRSGASRWLGIALAEEEQELSRAVRPSRAGPHDVLTALVCVAVIVVSSAAMERSAEDLGTSNHLSALVVGGILLAAITSLPNAVGGVVLAARGRGPALLSEAMNSNMLNVVAGLLLPGLFLGIGGVNSSGTMVALWYGGLTLACLGVAFVLRGLHRSWGVAIVATYACFVGLAVSR